MEEVENVVVELLDDVTDENGKKLLFVDMDVGYKGRSPISWMVWGKRVEEGVEVGSKKWGCVRLKREEGDRLRMDTSWEVQRGIV